MAALFLYTGVIRRFPDARLRAGPALLAGRYRYSRRPMSSELYWERRSSQLATAGGRQAAACAEGMPAFYDREIHARHRRALEPWLQVPRGARVLHVGGGVGSWGCELDARGARVTARAVADCDLQGRFDLILGVTVLERIPEQLALRAAILHLRAQLAEGGALLLLEAAPRRAVLMCNGHTFSARPRSLYLRLFADCGLRVRALTGVDPAGFSAWLLPYLPRLPGWARPALLAVVAALAIPINMLLGRRAAQDSWHVLFVLERATLRR
jgi:hypothetical protein